MGSKLKFLFKMFQNQCKHSERKAVYLCVEASSLESRTKNSMEKNSMQCSETSRVVVMFTSSPK